MAFFILTNNNSPKYITFNLTGHSPKDNFGYFLIRKKISIDIKLN